MPRKRTNTGDTIANTTPNLSARVSKAVKAITAQFRAFTRDFAAISVKREELAPQFMKAANLWMAETKGTFVDFVRLLDPAVGNTRAEYRDHRSYQAADYLRRLVSNASRKALAGGDADGNRAATPATATDAVARIMASLMEVIEAPAQQARIYEALSTQLHWTPRQVQRLQTQVQHVDPLVHIRARVEGLRLSFPAETEAAEAAA